MLGAPPAFVIAGTKSGCGKTTVALGLMAAFRRRGLKVAPFKTGPDFIDPGFHSLICGRPSHNLDGWMMPESALVDVFHAGSRDCDIAIIEGAMGLFDGASGGSEKGSAAHIAKVLGVPVLLVADGRGVGRSICAMVKGYVEYDSSLKVAGVIVNMVGGERHKEILQQALKELKLPFVATVKRRTEIKLPSRHLGLVTAREHKNWDRLVEGLGNLVEKEMDLDGLLETVSRYSSNRSLLLHEHDGTLFADTSCVPEVSKVKIAVARDKPFCFYYQRNLDILKALGAKLCHFSPSSGDSLPEGACGVYLGGGYPELYAKELARNQAFCQRLKEEIDRGIPVLAECGGFMFLGKGLLVEEGLFEWCGLFNSCFSMENRFQALGYRQAHLDRSCVLGDRGISFRGHEFRYSRVLSEIFPPWPYLRVYDASGKLVEVPHFVYKNVFASYIHIHFDSNPLVAENFVKRCREYLNRDFSNKGANQIPCN